MVGVGDNLVRIISGPLVGATAVGTSKAPARAVLAATRRRDYHEQVGLGCAWKILRPPAGIRRNR